MSILMADRILARQDAKHYSERLKEVDRNAVELFKDAVVVDGTEIGAYYEAKNQARWNVHKDIPCAMPPYPHMAVEVRFPHGLQGSDITGFVGFIASAKVSVENSVLASEETTDFAKDCQYLLDALVNPFNGKATFAGIFIYSRVSRSGSAGCVPLAYATYLVDEHGKFLESGLGIRLLSDISQESRNELAELVLATGAVPILLTLSFMNCKNVKVVDNEPAQKLSKAFQKRRGIPLTTYKTLEIEPMKKVLQTEGGIEHNGLKRALHLCRGHFATYTPEKGMLGRPLEHPVTVWKPAHVRGNADNSVVQKDYKIKAPKGE